MANNDVASSSKRTSSPLDSRQARSSTPSSSSWARQRELEYRRVKGHLSCAECKRLKLKCDRKVPCSTCVRRGCESVCPNGCIREYDMRKLAPGANKEVKGKMLAMRQRIHQLEGAIQEIDALLDRKPNLESNIPTIMLQGKRATVGADVDDDEGPAVKSHAQRPADARSGDAYLSELADDLAELTLDGLEEAGAIGRQSITSIFNLGKDRFVYDQTQNLSEIQSFSHSLAWGISRRDVLRTLEMSVPPYERAIMLQEEYYKSHAWLCRPILRGQLTSEIIPRVYGSFWKQQFKNNDQASSRGVANGEIDDVYVHQLAIFYAVLACGAVASASLPRKDGEDSEARRYEQYARIALGASSVIENTTLECVQAITLLGTYEFVSLRAVGFEAIWRTFATAAALGTHLNLHRDMDESDPTLKQRKRTIFWEMFFVQKWISFELGRPTVVNSHQIDCPFPEDTDASVSEDGSFKPSYWSWKYTCAKEVLAPASELMCRARPIKYSEVLELDRRIRDFNIKTVPDGSNDISRSAIFWKTTLKIYKETLLMTLHRNFFARAWVQSPKDVLSGQYAPSVLASCASALSLLKAMREEFEHHEHHMYQRWVIWVHSLIAAAVLGAIAIKRPSPNAATLSLRELKATIDLFERASTHPVARGGLPILRRLYAKAELAAVSAGDATSGEATPTLPTGKETAPGPSNKNKSSGTSTHERGELFLVDGDALSVFCSGATGNCSGSSYVLDEGHEGPQRDPSGERTPTQELYTGATCSSQTIGGDSGTPTPDVRMSQGETLWPNRDLFEAGQQLQPKGTQSGASTATFREESSHSPSTSTPTAPSETVSFNNNYGFENINGNFFERLPYVMNNATLDMDMPESGLLNDTMGPIDDPFNFLMKDVLSDSDSNNGGGIGGDALGGRGETAQVGGAGPEGMNDDGGDMMATIPTACQWPFIGELPGEMPWT